MVGKDIQIVSATFPIIYTHLKFNSSPLKGYLAKRKVISQPSIFRGELLNFGGVSFDKLLPQQLPGLCVCVSSRKKLRQVQKIMENLCGRPWQPENGPSTPKNLRIVDLHFKSSPQAELVNDALSISMLQLLLVIPPSNPLSPGPQRNSLAWTIDYSFSLSSSLPITVSYGFLILVSKKCEHLNAVSFFKNSLPQLSIYHDSFILLVGGFNPLEKYH